MLNKVWGFDTETVMNKGGGWPYTFQLTCGEKQIYYVNDSLNAEQFRAAFLKTVYENCEDGDALFSFNLFFENQVLFRDMLYKFIKNRICEKFHGCLIEGVLEDPTPFLKLRWKEKTVYVIDSAKFFGDGGGNTLASIAKSYTDIPKLERPSYLGQRKPKRSEEDYFRNYAMVDSLVTEELGKIVKKYHEETGLSEWCFSAAHLAGTSFRDFFTEGKKLDLANAHIEACASWARFGGYRQIHGQGGIYEKYAHLDLDSAYPWAMFNMRSYFQGNYYRSKRVPKDGEGLYKISTILPMDDIRPLFLKRGKNKIELQPLSVPVIFWTTGFEINAYRRVFPRWTYEIMEGWEWRGQSKKKPLREWVKKFHKLKSQVKKEDKLNKWKRDFAKAMLNHLTGKFDSSIELSKETWLTGKGEIELNEVRPGMLRNYFVAALLRAKVRARVWGDSRYWEQFPVKPSLQEMTDSMDIPLSELKRIKLKNGLGNWGKEIEGDIVFIRGGTYFYFQGKKLLKAAYHGLQLRDKNGNFDYKRLFGLILKGEGTYTRHRMVRAREALRTDGLSADTALSFYDKVFKVSFKNKLIEELTVWLRKNSWSIAHLLKGANGSTSSRPDRRLKGRSQRLLKSLQSSRIKGKNLLVSGRKSVKRGRSPLKRGRSSSRSAAAVRSRRSLMLAR